LRTSRPIREAVNEAERLPALVDRAGLVVHEAVREADLLHRLEGEVALDLRGLLRPRDPEAVRRVERRLQRLEAALELLSTRREEDDDASARLRPELLRERSARVVLIGGHAMPRGAPPRARVPAPPRSSSAPARARRVRSLRAGGTSVRRRLHARPPPDWPPPSPGRRSRAAPPSTPRRPAPAASRRRPT